MVKFQIRELLSFFCSDFYGDEIACVSIILANAPVRDSHQTAK